MGFDDDHRNLEAGSFSPFGWRRDSARRLPLRQTGFFLGRDLSPWRGTGGGHGDGAGAGQEVVALVRG
jgi:hypothetical protein